MFVQFSAEFPFFVALLPIRWEISRDTWRVAIAWLVFCGVMAHTKQIWISSHWKHHMRPDEGRYTFTGIGEAVIELIQGTFFEYESLTDSSEPIKTEPSSEEQIILRETESNTV
jgi:hypothetical protein